MKNIYRLLVDRYGDEEYLTGQGKLLYINCPFGKSLKIFSYPRWRYSKKKYRERLELYGITCISQHEYHYQNVTLNLLLKNLKKYDTFCVEFVGFSFEGIEQMHQALTQLDAHLAGKKLLVVVKKEAGENEILADIPVYHK